MIRWPPSSSDHNNKSEIKTRPGFDGEPNEKSKFYKTRLKKKIQREELLSITEHNYCTIKENTNSAKKRKQPPLSIQLLDLDCIYYLLDMKTNDFDTIFENTFRVRRWLSSDVSTYLPIREIIDSGIVPSLLKMLDMSQVEKYFEIQNEGDDMESVKSEQNEKGKKLISRSALVELQLHSCWAIANIASGTQENTQYIVELGSVPKIIELIDVEYVDLTNQCLWALGNITADTVENRDLVLEH